MPNQHGSDREPVGLMLPREKAYKLKKLAAQQGMTYAALLESAIDDIIRNVHLSSKDWEQIAKAALVAEETRRRNSTPLAR